MSNPMLSSNEQSALRKLEEIFQSGQFTLEDEEEVLELCQSYPILAFESFISSEGYGVLPLESLVVHRARLATIQSFCELAPNAPNQKNLWWQFPLHSACEGNSLPGIIPYLAKSFPRAASCKDMKDKRPIDYLLQRESALEDIQAALHVNAPTSVSDQDAILQAALEGPNHQVILEYIVDQCPKVNSFRADKLQHLSHDQAKALSQLLPQLKVFRFRSKKVKLSGWQHLMNSLGNCESIQRLHLDLERTMHVIGVSAALNHALASIPNVRDLTVLGQTRRRILHTHHDPSSSGSREEDGGTTGALVALLARNTLESIRIEHVPLDHHAIFEALQQSNTSLRRMYIVSCVDTEEKRKELCKVLLSNTSLQDVPLRSYGGDANTYDKIDYLAKLNRLGRRVARDPGTPLKKFVGMLHDANVRNGVSHRDTDHGAELARVQFLYGLLRECPSIWCG